MYLPTTPRKTQTIKPNQNHVGLYHWCSYWAVWDKILKVEGLWVTVVTCEQNTGEPIIGEPTRRHCTAMEAAMFADKPFAVTRG